MLKSFKIWLARRRIVRWEHPRGVLAFLGTWLPVWCGLAMLLWGGTRLFGYMLLLMIPVWVIGRYFIARRRADIVLQKIYSIVRLNHPLADALLLAGNSDTGAVGVRLQMLAELLQRGLPLSESLRLAVPELKTDDLAAIMEAEQSGRLLPVLARLTNRRQHWNISNELDVGLLLYFASVFGFFIITFIFFTALVEPKFQKIYSRWGIIIWNPWLQFSGWFSRGQGKHDVFAIVIVIVIAFFIAAGILLRRLVIPFFRRGTVSIYIRDALAWRLPLLGSLIRCRAWSDGTRILAQGVSVGRPLPEISQSAAEAVGSRVARRRLRKWRENMLTGMSAESAARKCGLPGMVCGALAQPMGSTGLALALVAGYYDLKYRRKIELIRAVSIPLMVLFLGFLVLLLCLALYVPYVRLLQVVGGGGG